MRAVRIAIVATILCLAPRLSLAQPIPGPCHDGVMPTGALVRICVPAAGWNGNLIVWAHGYIAFNQALAFHHLVLPDGTSIPDLVQSLGYAFATTSYRQNGLAILEGGEDIVQMTELFRALVTVPLKTFVDGVSEGGAVAALVAERAPFLFSGALSACGPIGNFQEQIQHIGHFRVLFDYFFPGVIPGSAIDIPVDVIAQWDSVYQPAVLAAVAANPSAAIELLNVANAPYDLAIPATIPNTIVNVLWYNIVGTNDAIAKLGGNPYGNRGRVFTGSSNDDLLNASVARFDPTLQALIAVTAYETSGDLTIPMVSLHTTGDEVIPAFQQFLYQQKVQPRDRGVFVPIPIGRYGHCNFTAGEALVGFLLLQSLN